MVSWSVCSVVHAVVARSTFRSQNVSNTSVSDHFWKLRGQKSARRCGAKHISKSKCTKHQGFGPLLEVQMSKKCTPVARSTFLGPLLEVAMSKKCMPLWREAHFEVKMLKTLGVRTTFGGSDVASLRFSTLHYITLHSTTVHYTTLHYTTLQRQLHNYTPLYSTTLNYTTLHYSTPHSTTLHYTTLHYTTLPSTALHYIALHCTPLHDNYNYNYTSPSDTYTSPSVASLCHP